MTQSPHDVITAGRRYQFSLRQLLLLMLAVAIGSAIAAAYYRQQQALKRPGLFLAAIRGGDLAEVDRLLKIDRQLAHGLEHSRTSSSHTPLQLALVFGKNPAVIGRILIERPDLEEKSSSGETVLHLAMQRPWQAIVPQLLELGADPNAVNREGFTSVHLAAREDQTGKLLELLIKQGGDPNRAQIGKDLQTPLHAAAEYGNLAATKALIAGGARADSVDAQGQTPLHNALRRNDEVVALLLIDHGGDLAAMDKAGRVPGYLNDGTISIAAAEVWWQYTVRLHKEQRVDELTKVAEAAKPVFASRSESTASTLLHRAVDTRNLDVLNFLLNRGLDPNVHGEWENTPLHIACWSHVPVTFITRLLDAGANIEAKNKFGQTPLHWAARSQHDEGIRTLVARGANLAATDHVGTTVLDAVFERQYHRMQDRKTLELLLSLGHPKTALYAAATGDLELLQKLTRSDLENLDRSYTQNGIRPMHAAVLGNQIKIVEWLLSQGVDRNPASTPNAIDKIDTPLMMALSYSLRDLAIFLIEHDLDVNFPGRSSHYPVHAVIDWDREPELLAALLAHGADLSLLYQGKTARDLANESKSKHKNRYLELLDAR